MKTDNASSYLVVTLAIAFSIIWSSAFIAGKIAITDAPPLYLLSVRFLAAGLIMIGAAWALGLLSPLTTRCVITLAILGLFNNAIYLGLSFFGLRFADASLVILMASTTPLSTSLLAKFILKEPFTARNISGLLIGFSGVALALQPQLTTPDQTAALGLLLALFGATSLSAGTILFKKRKFSIHLLPLNGFQTIFGGIILFPFAAFIEDESMIHLTLPLLLSTTYLIIAVSIGAVMIWFKLLTITKASTAASFHYLNPIFGLILGSTILSEKFDTGAYAGLMLITTSIYLITKQPAHSIKPPY